MLASPLVMQFQRRDAPSEGEKSQWQALFDKGKALVEEKTTWFNDHAQPGNLIPPVGVEVMSYGRLMQLLQAKQVRRIQVLGDGTAAIVDVRPPPLPQQTLPWHTVSCPTELTSFAELLLHLLAHRGLVRSAMPQCQSGQLLLARQVTRSMMAGGHGGLGNGPCGRHLPGPARQQVGCVPIRPFQSNWLCSWPTTSCAPPCLSCQHPWRQQSQPCLGAAPRPQAVHVRAA